MVHNSHTEYKASLIDVLNTVSFTWADGSTLAGYEAGMDCLVTMLAAVRGRGGKLLFAGNGGSAAISIHMTADFLKNAGFRTVNLFDGAVLTCLGNDYDFSEIFSRQIASLTCKGDLLVCVSSSGNSENVVQAVCAARKKGCGVVTLSGFQKENRIRSMGDLNIYVPAEHYGIVESIHGVILQEAVDFLCL